MKTIYLLRHGKIARQAEKRFVGQIDVPLDEEGLSQAKWWREELDKAAFGQIYCSDLIRSRETARIIAGEEHIHIMPQLREINLGEWDGLSKTEVRARFPGKWKKRGENLASYRPLGGESFTDLYARVIPVFEQIVKQAEKDAFIVGHAGVNRMILCHVLGVPLANLFRLGQDYASLNTIGCKEKPWRVIALNAQALTTIRS